MNTRATVTCRAKRRLCWAHRLGVTALFLLTAALPTAAQERLCDNSYEDCRATILSMIRAENVGLDVSIWFMTDWRYRARSSSAGEPACRCGFCWTCALTQNNPANASVRQNLIDAGIPIRHKTTHGINHWKMILYAGQAQVHFSAANFANGSYSPVTPYTGYVDEAIYFTGDPDVVHTFMTKYDDLWTDTTQYANLANVGTLTRHYPTYAMDP